MKKKIVILSIIFVILLVSFFLFNREVNIDGFNIKHGTLLSYTGSDTSVVVPDKVKVIGEYAFSSDMGYGKKLKKVIINENVKKIKDEAFAFTNADIIIINEGVKEIGDNVFMDSYIDEIYFPESLEKIGVNIMETEEGLDGTIIHLVKNSLADKYFKNNKPYGNITLVYAK